MQITNPAFNYDAHGHQYAGHRRTDPRIEAYVHKALGAAQTILNVGAGAGSYEPADRYVVAVEPSAVMRAQRLERGKVPAINAKADHLPFDDGSFDACMAMVTVHHWPDIEKGLAELRRVTRGPVVVMSFDPDALEVFWNAQYFPELIAVERARYPTIQRITAALGGHTEVIPVPIPLDCGWFSGSVLRSARSVSGAAGAQGAIGLGLFVRRFGGNISQPLGRGTGFRRMGSQIRAFPHGTFFHGRPSPRGEPIDLQFKNTIHPAPFLSWRGAGQRLLVTPHERFPILHDRVGGIGGGLFFKRKIRCGFHDHKQAVFHAVNFQAQNTGLADAEQNFGPHLSVMLLISGDQFRFGLKVEGEIVMHYSLAFQTRMVFW
jgi:hypothetical protein